MSQKILVTDSLFILDEHVKRLEKAGFEVERLDKPQASERELCNAVKGKVGYIQGGIEPITKKVIDAADQLRVISHTGIGYKSFIPAWEDATKKGIAITNAPDGPTHAVGEWAITIALAMNRHIFELGRTGKDSFTTTSGLEGQNIGIVGFGRIGKHIAKMLGVFRPAKIAYFSRHRFKSEEKNFGFIYKSLRQVLTDSDIIFLCLSDDAGKNFIGKNELASVKNGALLVSFMHYGIVNEKALLIELRAGRIRAASDYPMNGPINKEFSKLPLSQWYCFNSSNAFNTESEITYTSTMAVQSIINMLKKGNDKYLVNPEFRKYRK